MTQLSVLDRILLLVTGLLAAYQISAGIEGANLYAMTAYTIGFGILLVAGLLLILLGYDVLESQAVVILATLIPVGLSFGLVSEYLPAYQNLYLGWSVIGLLAVLATRWTLKGKAAAAVLAVTHGISGLLIFGLPILLSLRGTTAPGFALVGVGGGLIGVGGLLLTFLKAGKPLLGKERIYQLLPGLLLVMTASFVMGFAAA